MSNENDNKLVTLADLAEAYNALYNRDVTTTATQSANGLMSSSDKIKLDGIAAGAQVNAVTSVNNQTGAVSITPANIGAVAKTGDTMTGPLIIRDNFASYCLELEPPVGSGNGGYIDFAYNGEEIDNTSRIIETARGILNINDVVFDKAHPYIAITNGGTGATTPAGARNNLGIYPFHINVNIDSNGQGFINFNSIGMSSQPNVCFMEIVNVAGTIVRYNFDASTSQIVLEPFWINGDSIKNTTVAIQGIAFT